MTLPPLYLVAAVAKDGCIGRRGALPWRLPEDMKRFKALTMGHAIVMGRKTYESIGKPLPGRTSVVITSKALQVPQGVIIASDLETALARARAIDDAPRVIGGGEVYKAAMSRATHLEITHVDTLVPDGDAFFPAINPAEFAPIERTPAETPGIAFVTYRRETTRVA